MNRAALLLMLAALLCPSVARGEAFALPEIPAPLKPLLDARLDNERAIAGSLPAHPMAERFFDAFVKLLVEGMEREKVDRTTAHRLICRAYGDDDLGIFAVDRYAAVVGVQDGFLAWLVESHPNLRASCRAFSCLYLLSGTPPSSGAGRVSVFARLQAAAGQATGLDALCDTLFAWAEAVDARQARFAGAQGRALLNGDPFGALQPVFAFDPVPPALLRGLAEALRDPGVLAWLQAWSKQATAPIAEPVFASVAAISQFVSSDANSAGSLQGADVAVATLPDEVRVYLALPVAARLIQQLDLDNAAARLDAASALDTPGIQRGNIARLLQKCRAGLKP